MKLPSSLPGEVCILKTCSRGCQQSIKTVSLSVLITAFVFQSRCAKWSYSGSKTSVEAPLFPASILCSAATSSSISHPNSRNMCLTSLLSPYFLVATCSWVKLKRYALFRHFTNSSTSIGKCIAVPATLCLRPDAQIQQNQARIITKCIPPVVLIEVPGNSRLTRKLHYQRSNLDNCGASMNCYSASYRLA